MWKSNSSKMHGLSDIGPNVPAFLIKLWKLVNDPETDELICWSESKLSFVIHQPAKFARELLSMYYKHNNMASFIRQLNMYGFHKIVSEAGGLKSDKDWMEFAHQCFIKDHPYLLENIKRKLPNPKSGVVSNEEFTSNNLKNGTQSEILAKVLSDVNNLKGKQESWDARLTSMKRENEALWRELAIFRQKHLKQEQIINRPSRNVPLRRRYPLMLNDIQPVKKITKLSGADTSSINQGSPTGPTIHEIDTTDVLFGCPEQSEITTNEEEFISSDALSENTPNLIEVDCSEGSSKEKEIKGNGLIEGEENIPEDWLEVEMTEGDLIDPLTPIDPAKVNPAMAAATLKHLEGKSEMTAPIAITIPSVVTSNEFGKKNVTEKKVIYLTDENISQKSLKKKKPVVLKLDVAKKGLNDGVSSPSSPSGNLTLKLMLKNSKKPTRPVATAIKRKMVPSSPATSPKGIAGQNELVKKACTKSSERDIGIDDLEFLLTSKQPNDDLVQSRDFSESAEKDSSVDTFLKLDSLYNGTICEDQLAGDSAREPGDLYLTTKGKNLNSLAEEEDRLSASHLVDSPNELNSSKVDSSETAQSEMNFEPESMAVVCQQPSSTDSLARELNSHVDSVQGEIDYLKEMLKGEGYSFDATSLPWLFSDDPLSFGVLPAVEDEANQKKNEEPGVSGNELMAYGSSSNLMDLIDMMGSTPNGSQDWNQILSSASPAPSELTTPAPSPSAFAFPNPPSGRKKL